MALYKFRIIIIIIKVGPPVLSEEAAAWRSVQRISTAWLCSLTNVSRPALQVCCQLQRSGECFKEIGWYVTFLYIVICSNFSCQILRMNYSNMSQKLLQHSQQHVQWVRFTIKANTRNQSGIFKQTFCVPHHSEQHSVILLSAKFWLMVCCELRQYSPFISTLVSRTNWSYYYHTMPYVEYLNPTYSIVVVLPCSNVNNFIQITQQSWESRLWRSSCRTCQASRARRVERVELVVSSVSSRAVRQARHSQNAWVRHVARHVERVESCRVETWRANWNLG